MTAGCGSAWTDLGLRDSVTTPRLPHPFIYPCSMVSTRRTYSPCSKTGGLVDEAVLSSGDQADAYTSQRCSACGHVEKGNRTSQAEFLCLSCGHEANAELNAAINILEAASSTDSLNACGADVSRVKSRLDPQLAVKQEPGISLMGESDRGISLATVRSLVPA